MLTIYLSAVGDDNNTGISIDSPLLTLSAAQSRITNETALLLRGGDTFNGSLSLAGLHNISIGSYGAEIAEISSENTAIHIQNCVNVDISRIRLTGQGWRVINRSCGLLMERTDHSTIRTVEVTGFHKHGIAINGCDNTDIIGCYAHFNGATGIHTGSADNHPCKNLRIAHCRVYDNPGDIENTENHSGSGIVIAATIHGTVEFCDAAGNGWGQRQINVNGPVGIWCCCGCEDVVFRYNICRNNRTQPGAVDGDGMDIDGEVCDSVMEYNYTYGNEGSGYLLCEFWGDCTDTPWQNNIMRYNVSIDDDTRVPDYGAVRISSPDNVFFESMSITRNLLIAADGLACIYNQHVPATVRDLSITENWLITDGREGIVDQNHAQTSVQGNADFTSPDTRCTLSNSAPRLTEPRDLPNQPVFQWMKHQRPLEANPAEAVLFYPLQEDSKAEGFLMMELQLSGPDYEGTEKWGDAALTYDSLLPGTVTRLTGDSGVVAPLPWWEKSKRYIVRGTIRLQTPDTIACLFIRDEAGAETRAYFNASSGIYTIAELAFTAGDKWFDPGKYVGVRSQNGSALIYSIEFIELASDDSYQPMSNNDFRRWGDVYRQENTWHLHDGAQIEKTVQSTGTVTFTFDCGLNNAEGKIYIIHGGQKIEYPLIDGKNTITQAVQAGTAVRMGIAQLTKGVITAVFDSEDYGGGPMRAGEETE